MKRSSRKHACIKTVFQRQTHLHSLQQDALRLRMQFRKDIFVEKTSLSCVGGETG